MSSGQGYASDGTTLVEVVKGFEDEGYTVQMVAKEGGRIQCLSCREESPAGEFRLVMLRRTEGASDPDDMAAVAAVHCPRCQEKGTLVLKYGPEASLADADVMAALSARENAVPSTETQPPGDSSSPSASG